MTDLLQRRHHWDGIRQRPTVIESIPIGSRGCHESLLRSWSVLREVEKMLQRGDSSETVLAFIAYAEGGYVDG